ncbi:MAG: zinc ABC transporter substrate-binding protein [Gammaproteobacteria bacterium]|nr:zinc ABC transporter substrate-binding protein [Gammaproteobacteria bacterium]
MHTVTKYLRAFGIVGVISLSAFVSSARAITVFACEPEWAALTRILLPEARIHVATHAGQDPHHIEARPALIAQMRSADLAVCTGAGLEVGWLATLIQRSGNARVKEVFYAADYVTLIGSQPNAIATPWTGDIHAEGNPHLHMDPRNLLRVASALSKRLGEQLPSDKAAIATRQAMFEARWRILIERWKERALPLAKQQVVAQHTALSYLWNWLDMQQIADLEPKPGLAPTPVHLQGLLETLRHKPLLAVLISSYQDARPARWLIKQLTTTGSMPIPLLVLPATVAVDADEKGLVQWFDGILNELLEALK